MATETIQAKTITSQREIREIASEEDRKDLVYIANTMRQQIGVGVFMSLGAHNLRALFARGVVENGEDGLSYVADPTLAFNARILPFTASGKRGSAPRIMEVTVTLNGLDYYDVAVKYLNRGKLVEHYSGTNIDASRLGDILFALDYDGDTALNPRVI